MPISCFGMNNQQAKLIHRINKCTQEIKQAQEKINTIDTLIEQCKPLSTDLLFKKELWEIVENSWADTDLACDFEYLAEKESDYRNLWNDEIRNAKNRILHLANTRLIFTNRINDKQAELEKLKKCLAAK